MDELYRPRGRVNRVFSRGRSYSLDEITRLAGRHQLTVHDGRGGQHVRRASRLLVRDHTGKNPDTVFVRDYAQRNDQVTEKLDLKR